jgi:hypothetical protein
MSKTPRTDALVRLQEDAFGIPGNPLAAIVSAKFAREIEEENTDLKRQRDELLKALGNMLELYLGIANSGDCGFWDAEKEDEVKAARVAIAKASRCGSKSHGGILTCDRTRGHSGRCSMGAVGPIAKGTWDNPDQ